jgi:hypothetical protein
MVFCVSPSMSRCHLGSLSSLGPHRFNASLNPEYGRIGMVVVGVGPPGYDCNPGWCGVVVAPCPPGRRPARAVSVGKPSLAPSLDFEPGTTRMGVGSLLLWRENSMSPMGVLPPTVPGGLKPSNTPLMNFHHLIITVGPGVAWAGICPPSPSLTASSQVKHVREAFHVAGAKMRFG